MTTINASATTPVMGQFNTNPSYSGSFIPTLWSSKLNAKFYAASTFASICNTDWEGEINGLGDNVVINNIPDIVISDYTIGSSLSYQVPAPNTVELSIDQGKSFAFQLSDVLAYQSQPNLMEMFSNDASEQMRVAIDFANLRDINGSADPYNMGSTAGAKSGAYNLGTDLSPVVLTGANVLSSIMNLAAVLDEYNIPETGRWLVIDPQTRILLLSSPLAQAQYMGDATSPVRNGLIGRIDRFDIYVSNQLPRGAAGYTFPTKANPTGVTETGAQVRRAIYAGHTSAIAFASQMTKTETLRNPNDFGDLVRGLQVYGRKVVKAQSLAQMIVQ